MSSRPIMRNNCAIRQHTADRIPTGRCWYFLKNNVCPLHGDVTEAQKRYCETGQVTNDYDLPVSLPKPSSVE